ncbi:MAG: bifunctional UDP-N-acetylglucosamine diphosphorylase/glucosamine-1-phosphate N-acetyltransferase GlmU [Desulfomonilaceae bacterium]
MKEIAALILAAGKGTRMKSGVCKVLHPVAGRPMISYVIDAVLSCGLQKIVIVVGHESVEVCKIAGVPGIEFALQEPQLGTGHAVASARDLFKGFSGDVLILCGDIPLVQSRTIEEFVRFHRENSSKLTVMTTFPEIVAGYGRIMRTDQGQVAGIVEDRDADEAEKAVREINTGVYLANAELLYSLVDKIGADNSQGEYYLTDIVKEATKQAIPVHAFVLANAKEATGINTRADLARVSAMVWNRLREDMMSSGVTLLDPSSVYIDSQVRVGVDTVIHPCVTISGRTEIGQNCVIESGVYIMDSILGDGVRILQGSRLDRALVETGTAVGPMANLRPDAKIGKNARIGNFVEVKKTTLGNGSKAAHLTYLGDSLIGADVNIGCGTITCNYDGKKKHPTTIGDRCFIGSDVQFIAPVEIGEGSIVGAGSTITRDVPARSLAVSRAKQKIFPLRRGQGPGASDEDRKS